jgi:isoleucyl-tRNA synthetase
MFKPVDKKPNVNDVEHDQLTFWRKGDILKRTMEEREGGPTFVFYEGPPTANGRPGSHHVLARAFKDIFPRYKTMNGFYVLRKAGWDTHGLPVEIEVEKELGFENKQDIEDYGIAEFNAKCRESVLRYIEEWEELTERIAFWVDTDQAYYTFTNDFIESVWWILSEFWKKGLLYEGYKVVPYCPRCGTPLSSHEVNQGYDHADDPSLYVRFPVVGEENTFFLAWTTTPWTLPGNVGLVVGEDIDYVKLKGENRDGETEYIYAARELLNPHSKKLQTSGDDEEEAVDTARPLVVKWLNEYEIVEELKGSELVGRSYEPLFSYLPIEEGKRHHVVLSADFVSTEDGTGIVHMAPAFGADDLVVGQQNNLPVLLTVDEEGRFVQEVEDFAGQWVKEADPHIVENLEERGLVFRHGTYGHRYPFCWRCDTPLLYYARPTWFVRTSSMRDELVALNQTINWVPTHIRDGRFGNWLENNIDWALGRERYWGTPLPVWECDTCDHQHCVSGTEELTDLTGTDQSELDLHRPYVDDVTWACTQCDEGTMHRVEELIDVWFDSGAMPIAQWGYPHENQEAFKNQYPADYICEAIDQTRGWFYSLHAISTLLNESVAYKNVICLGHILDGDGKKMSKSKGNAVAPWDVIDLFGADVFRWYMFTAGPPGDSRRFSLELVSESFKAFWLTLWNTYRFFVEYANLDGFNPAETPAPPAEERSRLDRWTIARLHALTREVTEAFEHYDVPNATRPIERFVIDELSNWYVRLSRPRFWKTEDEADKLAAYHTLYEALVTVSKLLAPSMPFLAEELYRNLVGSVDADAPVSVHLTRWPEVDEALLDEGLLSDMATVERLVSLGRAARNSVNIKMRQPLAEAAFSLPAEQAHLIEDYAALFRDELNVKTVTALDKADRVIEYALNPLPSELGPRFGSDFPAIQKLLREQEEEDYAKALMAGDSITVPFKGDEVTLTPTEVEVRINPAEGYAVAEDRYHLAAVRTELSEELAAEGLAREFIRRVQVARKEADFDVDDRITTQYTASERLAAAVEQFADEIKTETLTDDLHAAAEPSGEYTLEDDFDDEHVRLSVARQ